MRRSRLALTVVVLIAGTFGCVPAPPRVPTPLPPAPFDLADEAWVYGTLAGMSLEERVGQMLMVGLDGTFANAGSESLKEAERLVEEGRVGGFVVGIGAPLDIAVKLNRLQGRARLPLLFAAEMEWGAGMRLGRPTYLSSAVEGAGGTILPYSMGLAATGDPAVAELAGRITAREARAVGIHWIFAPVVDINPVSDPLAAIDNFGSDATLVATYATSFIRGAAVGGVLTTARHFPGVAALPDPLQDGNGTVADLDARELLPFRAAAAAGVSSIMIGHAAVASAAHGAVPASMAPAIATGLLRGHLGFRGLVVTDALTSDAARDGPAHTPGEIAVRAVEAGADVVLSPSDPVLAQRALVSAVRSGRIHYTRVDSSVARILRAKARVGLHRERMVSLDSVVRTVGSPEHEAVARDIAARSLTLVRDSARVLPFDPRRVHELAVIVFSGTGNVRAGTDLVRELRTLYGQAVSYTRVDENSSIAVHDSAIARARRADATLFATFVAPAGRGRVPLPAAAHTLAGRVSAASPRMAVVSFGDVWASARLAGAATYLVAWQPHGDAAQRAAAHAIAGRAPVTGRLRVLMPDPAPAVDLVRVDDVLRPATPSEVGMDSLQLLRVDSIILAGILKGASPGATIAIGRHGRLVRLRGYGDIDRRRGFAPATESTIYDLASITKVVATTTAFMMLVDQGLLSLDDPVRKHIPEWRGSAAKESVTLRNLLLHNAGLVAYAPLWRELRGRDQYRRRIASMSLEYPPGTRTVYSDFGVILLALIIEQVSGQPLDVLLHDRLFSPLDMRETGFNPLQWPYATMDIDSDADQARAQDPLIARIAPTEIDTVYRMRHIRGQVHDENAFALGGVAGHAGLFSSARDLAVFAQMMLNGGFYGGRRFIDPATIALFTGQHGPESSRALGWDTPAAGSSAGNYFSASSYGHTGFTGPSIWIDPERDVFVVLLLNRVNPTRDNQRHLALRREVADAVQRAIRDMPVPPRDDSR
jgi:beta-N-acetylhexosaminidase